MIFITHNPITPAQSAIASCSSTAATPWRLRQDEITRTELTRLMAGGAELEQLEHEIGIRWFDDRAIGNPLELITVAESALISIERGRASFIDPQTFTKSIGGAQPMLR